MIRAVGYIRVSTTHQASDGLSLDAQKRKLRGYAELHDLRLVAIHTDAGVSAKTLDRPALVEALRTLDEGEADALLVVKLDRLTRSVRDLGTLIDRYFGEKVGKSLMSVQDAIDTRTANGRMVLNVLTSIAQWEREAVAERTRAVLEMKRANGEYTGGKVPYGYRKVTRKGVVFLEVEPREREVMEVVRDMVESGETYQATADFLNEHEFDARSDRGWGRQAVARVWARVQEEKENEA